MAESKGLSLRYEFDNMNYFITADRGRIVEIFTNLIDNAIKYSIKGEVVVSHKVEKGVLKTIIRDTGIGMSAKERDKLFTRFYRIQNEKTQSINGTGLGLWIIKQYIEAMGGKIYVDSLENVGTEFTVEFPLTTQKQITPAA
jgi:signal transduction histidine kinase